MNPISEFKVSQSTWQTPLELKSRCSITRYVVFAYSSPLGLFLEWSQILLRSNSYSTAVTICSTT